jgi:nitrous oxidase accessory protein NosD
MGASASFIVEISDPFSVGV